MKEEIQITRYEIPDDDLTSIINLHKLISKETNLNEHLIYFDPNFIFFFENVIGNKTTDFVSVLKINNVLRGFIHFKLFENKIFLNNICLDESCQGKGLGKRFLKESLTLAYDGSQENFELDVFLSNRKALKWYVSLGLEIKKKSIWMKIVKDSDELNSEDTSEIYFLKDNNGFDSIFFRDNKVATIVNNKTILIHDLLCLEKLPSQTYTIITNQDVKKYCGSRYQFNDLEISARMNGRIKDVFDNLNTTNA